MVQLMDIDSFIVTYRWYLSSRTIIEEYFSLLAPYNDGIRCWLGMLEFGEAWCCKALD